MAALRVAQERAFTSRRVQAERAMAKEHKTMTGVGSMSNLSDKRASLESLQLAFRDSSVGDQPAAAGRRSSAAVPGASWRIGAAGWERAAHGKARAASTGPMAVKTDGTDAVPAAGAAPKRGRRSSADATGAHL
jgi:hypothetical protein